ncbi:MAG: arginine deiminase [Propionibacteriaceae bacterium]
MTAISWNANSGVTSEVGTLRAVMLHRPGNELRRLTPRNSADLLFDGMPWVSRAQDEHDAFAQVLRDRDIQVFLLGDLLRETLTIAEARRVGIEQMMADLWLSDSLRGFLTTAFADYSSEELAEVMMAGLRNDELPGGHRSLVSAMMHPEDFIIRPLPNLLFTRDSSVWIGNNPAVTSLTFVARQRENRITELIYTYHPNFADRTPFYGWKNEHVEGGDVLALAPGVLAIGAGERTTPAGVERLAATVFERGDIHTVLAVPLDAARSMMHLDTVCTMVDVDAVTIYPNVADSLTAFVITAGDEPGALKVAQPRPFLEAAADAMGLDRLRLVAGGLDAHTAEREQWDDGNNTLTIAPKVCVVYERNDETNSRLEAAGIEVVRIVGSELGSGRGGPRCMSCPIWRDPLPDSK